jgi:hypothetical protein
MATIGFIGPASGRHNAEFTPDWARDLAPLFTAAADEADAQRLTDGDDGGLSLRRIEI